MRLAGELVTASNVVDVMLADRKLAHSRPNRC
jgi:hypothetical protein